MATSKHWHLINGSSGCLPDSNEVYNTKESAIESAITLFSDVEEAFITDIRRFHYHQFKDYQSAGADYVEIVKCYDKECLKEAEY
jgi:hypothetical protein